MMRRLVKDLRKQAISSNGQPPCEQGEASSRSGLRQKPVVSSYVNDSGTESDEELEMLGNAMQHQRDYEDFLSGTANPPQLSDLPPTTDADDVSWDSVGRESGILTGDGSDSDEDPTTPKQRRRMVLQSTTISKQQCEFPPMSMLGEKRRHADRSTGAATPQQQAVIGDESPSPNSRLEDRPRNIAVRRCPVRLLVNRPPPCGRSCGANLLVTSDPPPDNHEPVKRSRFSRPTLDFDKMLRNRFDGASAGSDSSSSAFKSYSPQE